MKKLHLRHNFSRYSKGFQTSYSRVDIRLCKRRSCDKFIMNLFDSKLSSSSILEEDIQKTILQIKNKLIQQKQKYLRDSHILFKEKAGINIGENYCTCCGLEQSVHT